MAANVYYSVCPFGTGNLLSGGSPTIEVDSSGNATLTLNGATLVNNIGQGVEVRYNNIRSFISHITDLTHFKLVDRLGVPASAQASTAVTSINHAMETLGSINSESRGLRAAIKLGTGDLVTADVYVNIACYFDHDDYTTDEAESFVLSGSTFITDSTRTFRFYAPRGLAFNESIIDQRAGGKWNSQRWIFSRNESIILNAHNVVVEGLQFHSGGLSFTSESDAPYVKDCIIRCHTAGSAYGILFNGAGSTIGTVDNCIIYGGFARGIARYYDGAGRIVYVRNSTISGCSTSGIAARQANSIYAINCAVFNNADDFEGTFPAGGITYCARDDADAGIGNIDISPSATEADDWAAAFTDYANGDFSLKSGSPLIDAGIGPALDSNVPTTDIVGTPRSGNTCSIGAFEFVDEGDSSSIWDSSSITGPITIEASCADGISMSDVTSRLAILQALSQDGMRFSESSVSLAALLATITEGITAGDTPSPVSLLNALSQDGMRFSESSVSLAALLAAITDGVTAGDTPSPVSLLNALALDGVAVTDLASALSLLNALVQDTTLIGDVPTGLKLLQAVITETINLGDLILTEAILQALVMDGAVVSDTVIGTIISALTCLVEDGLLFSDTTAAMADLKGQAQDGIRFGDILTQIIQLIGTVSDGISLGDISAWDSALSALACDGIVLSDSASRLLRAFVSCADGIILTDGGTVRADFTVRVADGVQLSEVLAAVARLYATASDGVEFSDQTMEVTATIQGRITVTLTLRKGTLVFNIVKPNNTTNLI